MPASRPACLRRRGRGTRRRADSIAMSWRLSGLTAASPLLDMCAVTTGEHTYRRWCTVGNGYVSSTSHNSFGQTSGELCEVHRTSRQGAVPKVTSPDRLVHAPVTQRDVASCAEATSLRPHTLPMRCAGAQRGQEDLLSPPAVLLRRPTRATRRPAGSPAAAASARCHR